MNHLGRLLAPTLLALLVAPVAAAAPPVVIDGDMGE